MIPKKKSKIDVPFSSELFHSTCPLVVSHQAWKTRAFSSSLSSSDILLVIL